MTSLIAQQYCRDVAPEMLHTTKENNLVPAQAASALRLGAPLLQERVGGKSAHVPSTTMKMQLFNSVLLRPHSTDPRCVAKPVGDGGTGAALRNKPWGAKWSPEEGKHLLAVRICLLVETAEQLLL